MLQLNWQLSEPIKVNKKNTFDGIKGICSLWI
jgi:hypothetical protein